MSLLGSKCHHEPRKSHQSLPIASAHQGKRHDLVCGDVGTVHSTCPSCLLRRQGRRCTGILSHPCSHGQAFYGLVPLSPRVVSHTDRVCPTSTLKSIRTPCLRCFFSFPFTSTLFRPSLFRPLIASPSSDAFLVSVLVAESISNPTSSVGRFPHLRPLCHCLFGYAIRASAC
jgi:hypothetical protein